MLAKLLHNRLDGDELQEEKKNLVGRMEDVAAEKDEPSKKVADLEATKGVRV